MGITSNGALKRDDNDSPVMGGTSSSDNATIINAAFDPVTRRLLTDSAAGSGTVTSVSVVTANGFAGSVATATTTPAITLSTTITGVLKGNGTAISAASPSTDYAALAFKTIAVSGQSNVVAASPIDTLTLVGGSNVTITTNAGTGTVTIASSGGASGITIGTTTITSGTNTRILYDNSGVVGEYTLTGSGTVVAMQTAPSFLTSITTPSVLASSNGSGSLGASGTAFSNLFLASTGVINWAAGNVTLTHSTGILTQNAGELRITSANVGTNADSVPTLSSTSTFTNKTLTTPTLTTPVINGASTGTGVASAASASTLMQRDANVNTNVNNIFEGFTTTATAAGTTALTVASTYTQVFTGVTTQTVTLPTTSIAAGAIYVIINQSTGAVTVQSSGANTIVILAAGTSAAFTAVVATPTTAANWAFQYIGDVVASGKKLSVSNTLTLAGTDATTMTFPSTSATIARIDAGQTFTGVQNFTSPDTTTSITTSTTSFTAWAGATTLLTIGGTGASASMFAPSTLDATSSITGAIRTSGGISAAKALNVGTTITGGGNLTIGTSNSATVGTIELGAATDTTLARVSAGVISVEGVTIPSISSTNTLTNKRITRRLTTVSGPGATPSTNTDNVDIANFTALAAAITSMTTNLSGSPVDGDLVEFRFTDNGTARAITWGASFGATTVALPTTTVISTMLRALFEWNGSIWQCIAVA